MVFIEWLPEGHPFVAFRAGKCSKVEHVVRQMMYRLTNPLHEYGWGSLDAIFNQFGWDPTGSPAAELWLGAHSSAPSLARSADQIPATWSDFHVASASGSINDGASLIELIRSDPAFMLGDLVESAYGPRLPYLLKILAADQPLSLQVHPKPHIARRGFQRENALGLPVGSLERNYKDDQHKPEMILALTPFEGLSGFRRPRRTLELLENIAGETAARMREALAKTPNALGVQEAFSVALELRDTQCAAELAEANESIEKIVGERRALGLRVWRGHQTALELFARYPQDPGALVSLMLNRFSLQPGEAVFLEAGQVHAYLEGLGVEIMASSDNVLRAGLTPKKVDVPELIECTDFMPAPPSRPALRAGTGGLTEYRPGVSEFALLFGQVQGVSIVPHNGPRIVICLDGELEVSGVLGPLGVLRSGQSAFVPHGVGNLGLRGSGKVAVAYVP